MNNELLVYTALFGDYDELIEPKNNFHGCKFICYTDQNNLKSDIWEIRLVEKYDLLPIMMNRKYKLLPHLFFSNYQKSLYVDGNVYILKNPLTLSCLYLDSYDIAIPFHFKRNCIYKEAKEVIKLKKAIRDEVENQVFNYKKEGFPSNFGLTENNIIFRNHNKLTSILLMEEWWKEINYFTKRDQLSLMYVSWKNKIHIKMIKETARGGEYFNLRLHKSEKCANEVNFFLEKRINYPNNPLIKLAAKVIKKLRCQL